ncbi:MAG: hypothetical protein ACHRHE_24650 [Tepidisphaerales bacterium]
MERRDGKNRRPAATPVGGIFFPQSKSLGIDRSQYSPSLQRKIVYAGVAHGSFEQGQQSLQELADVAVSAKQVERLTRAIGSERVAERTAAVTAFQELPLADKHRTPAEVTSPDVAVIEVDGGRLQIRERDAARVAAAEDEAAASSCGREKGKHWREDKAALLLSVTSEVAAADPCPQIPETFVDPTRILKLAREIHAVSAGQDGVAEPQPETGSAEQPSSTATAYAPPTIRTRQVVASRVRWPDFAPLVAEAARTAGLLGAARRAFVGDGSDNNWAIWRRFFSSWTAIIDFIHVLSYIFAAATAGRKFAEGWPVYVRWIEWLWQGQPERVIVELAQRQVELGVPEAADGETSPRRLVADALTYLQNHKDKMRYDEYRRQGLPLTSSHMESLMKQINQRVKGTEKFWCEEGAEAILQLRADHLSDARPLDAFWERRQASETGQRRYRRAA